MPKLHPLMVDCLDEIRRGYGLPPAPNGGMPEHSRGRAVKDADWAPREFAVMPGDRIEVREICDYSEADEHLHEADRDEAERFRAENDRDSDYGDRSY